MRTTSMKGACVRAWRLSEMYVSLHSRRRLMPHRAAIGGEGEDRPMTRKELRKQEKKALKAEQRRVGLNEV
jgi:hypothetical protein